ncbi:MAG TPA: SMUG2 DNA glycosylase family protein [Anseongella sp.]|nr:SMUG2 DNA glycosylase family protein [Anseongella sp.]
MTFADKVMEFISRLEYEGAGLPAGIRVLNPYRESGRALETAGAFYRKYYGDTEPRFIILGINPGRFGGGATGIPFTDSKRLVSECRISYPGKATHEPSSVFVYEMINAYGGAGAFYRKFYINSLFPLALTKASGKGKEKNHNYYDSKELTSLVRGFIVDNIRKQLALGIDTRVCFCFGAGKNEAFLRSLNEEYAFFKNIVALEHPRYIAQYKSAQKQFYIDKYISAFRAWDN